MSSSMQQVADARSIANSDPERARAMFETLAAGAPSDFWSEAHVELAILAYGAWRLDEMAQRANAVLLSKAGTPWANAVASVLTNLAADLTDHPVDEEVLLRSVTRCVEVGAPYYAALARSLLATSRHRAGDRPSAIAHLRAAANLYEAAGSMTAGPAVLLRLSEALMADGDHDGATDALQQGLTYLARFPYGGMNVRRLTERLQAAETELRERRRA